MMKTIKITLFLATIACLSGLSIGMVNSFTEPIIKENALKSEKINLELIFPGGEFNLIEYGDNDDAVISIYEVPNKGYVFKTTAIGYNSSVPIVALIGMDQEGTIVNVIPLEEQETSGVGSKCFEESNIKKLYIGKTINQQVDGVTGATFTSNAMKIMITKAKEAFRKIK